MKTHLFNTMNRVFVPVLVCLFASVTGAADAPNAMEVISGGSGNGSVASRQSEHVPWGYRNNWAIDDLAKRNGIQTECDRLTTNLRNPDRKAMPVEFSDIDPALAIPSCQAALAGQPGNPRLLVNLSRAYNKAEKYDLSYKYAQEAATLGYPYAFHFLAIHHRLGEGTAKDPKKERELMTKAAAQGVAASALRLAALYLQNPPAADLVAAESFLLKSGYFADSSSKIWGKYYEARAAYLLKEKTTLFSVLFPNEWDDVLASKRNVMRSIRSMDPAALREYRNLISSAIAHFTDHLEQNDNRLIRRRRDQLALHVGNL